MPPLLQNTTLCAIVRNEEMNPAGGIRKFLEASAPYVEHVVILDTGSEDGTLQIIREFQKSSPNVYLYEKPWRGFADAKNSVVALARTDWVLILDADEMFTIEDYREIAALLENQPAVVGVSFRALQIHPDKKSFYGVIPNPKLFRRSREFVFRPINLKNSSGTPESGEPYTIAQAGPYGLDLLLTSDEKHYAELSPGVVYIRDVELKHYKPAKAALREKHRAYFWMERIPFHWLYGILERTGLVRIAPAKSSWKKPVTPKGESR